MNFELTDNPYPLRPRRVKRSRGHDEENVRRELSQILLRARSVASRSRAEFADGTDAYDVASMLIIRLASLTEQPEFGPWAAMLTDDEINAIRTMRNIVAHSGYASMNDDIFWETVTRNVPELVERLLSYGE